MTAIFLLMSRHRPAGYDKYYMNANCASCGAWTNEEYAWRFGEHEPHVFCTPCQRKHDKKAHFNAKHPQNHKRHVICSECKTLIRIVLSQPDNKTFYERCPSCIK